MFLCLQSLINEKGVTSCSLSKVAMSMFPMVLSTANWELYSSCTILFRDSTSHDLIKISMFYSRIVFFALFNIYNRLYISNRFSKIFFKWGKSLTSKSVCVGNTLKHKQPYTDIFQIFWINRGDKAFIYWPNLIIAEHKTPIY